MKKEQVWLAAAGIVLRDDEALVVKKAYGGMKGLWSFPAGFVQAGETVDQAAVREVKEETAIDARVKEIVGVRTGVLKNEVSDNMVIFLMEYEGGAPHPQAGEIEEAVFMPVRALMEHPLSTEYMKIILPELWKEKTYLTGKEYQPRPVYGYKKYKVFK